MLELSALDCQPDKTHPTAALSKPSLDMNREKATRIYRKRLGFRGMPNT